MPKINPRRTTALDDHPALKGKQSRLPDALQAKIIGSKIRKTAELNKVAFKYNRDALGALGGSLLGGGLGYASSTDGKNKTPDNRLKRTLIGAGIGGGVGLGFGRMSRKLKGAQDNFAESQSHLNSAKSRIRKQDEAYENLSQQRDRIQGEADKLRQQKSDLVDKYNEQTIRSRVDNRQRERALAQQQADADAKYEALQRDSQVRQQRLSDEVERSQLRAQVRDAMDPNNQIPESVLRGMSPDQLRSAMRKRTMRRADAENAVDSVAEAAEDRQSALKRLKSLKKQEVDARAFSASGQGMSPDEIAKYEQRQNIEPGTALVRLKAELPDDAEADRYYESVQRGYSPRKQKFLARRRKKIQEQFRDDIRERIGPKLKLDAEKTSAFASRIKLASLTKLAGNLEGRMARRQLTEICEMAQELLMYMGDEEDLHEWVQNKLTTIHDRLSSVHSYVSYEKKNPPMMMQPQILGGQSI